MSQKLTLAWQEKALFALKDMELLMRINAPMQDGSPMHKRLKKLIKEAP